MTNRWEIVPADDFSDKSQWTANGKNRWSALRVRLLIVSTNGKASRLGPVVIEHDVAPGDTIKLRVKRERIVTSTATISEALRSASKVRILESLSEQIGSELSAKAPGFSGKVKAQTSTQSEQELTHEVEKTLGSTSSHTVQDLEGQEHEIELRGETAVRRAQLRRRYWPRHWSVYLHSYDFLELSYQRRWLWKDVRKTIKRVDGQRLGSPLFSLTFYEPQADLVVAYNPVPEELDNAESFEIAPLTVPMPAVSAPALQDLEAAAKLAFPTSRAERLEAQRNRKARGLALKGAKKAGRPKRSKKKAATKKKAVSKKKAAPRKRASAKKKAKRGP